MLLSHKIVRRIIPIFRKRRMREFLSHFSSYTKANILDVGGTPFNWALAGFPHNVTMVNLLPLEDRVDGHANMRFVTGDARKLDYADNSFDIVFSNSVIEHVGDFDDQKAFAREVRRLAPNLWIQTPARCFFLEPHYLTPFFHFLPKSWQHRCGRNFTVWGWLDRPSQAEVDRRVNEIRLLNRREMELLFPDCDIRTERFLGMTKSYIAVRRSESGAAAGGVGGRS